ncbi:iron uptake porin [Pleurocapsa sp. PCC 7319]|uniref:iron uptake porin n=1 Tax=Pleurocapsa sp. PCC 7319 TaxID=118161 RepID=UPI000345CE88|nr:iron uptake porin [Pleurocapsa sp. PCC 7319]
MIKIKHPALIGTVALLHTVLFSGNSTVSAQEVDLSNPDAIANYADLADPLQSDANVESSADNSLGQVTNVNQLRDVAPTDWAYEALRSLVDRYGCIAGFPNQTYRGSQALTRYEFAAGLNSCLNQIERLIASSESVSQEDLDAIQRLTQEFEAELATLGGKVDELESRTAFLEDNQFSTTTQLQGEVVFNLAEAFGDDIDSETTFSERVRLQLVSSFTGKDKLFTRLTTGNIGNSFQDETGTREGRFAFDGPGDNSITIDRLHYNFPLLNDNLKVTAMAGLAAHHFYAETFNSGLDVGGGANGALTRFGERNPIYRQGIANSSAGIGATYSFGDFVEVSGGYISPTASDPNDANGLFNGSFSALGQIAVTPIEPLKIGFTYVRGYDNEQAGLDDAGDPAGFRGSFLWGATGTNFANFRGVGVTNEPIATNSFGAQFQFDITPTISVRGWGGFTDANIINSGGNDDNGDADIWNYAGALVVSDLIKEGSMAALIVGAEPYLTSIDADGDGNDETITNDVPIHLEALYKYQLNDNISITPGLIWLATPNQDSNNDDIFIGALRTTFTF